MKNGRRIVVKFGTSTLTGGARQLSHPRMVDLARQIAHVRDLGVEVDFGVFRGDCGRAGNTGFP